MSHYLNKPLLGDEFGDSEAMSPRKNQMWLSITHLHIVRLLLVGFVHPKMLPGLPGARYVTEVTS